MKTNNEAEKFLKDRNIRNLAIAVDAEDCDKIIMLAELLTDFAKEQLILKQTNNNENK